jgi:hypothetical protein
MLLCELTDDARGLASSIDATNITNTVYTVLTGGSEVESGKFGSVSSGTRHRAPLQLRRFVSLSSSINRTEPLPRLVPQSGRFDTTDLRDQLGASKAGKNYRLVAQDEGHAGLTQFGTADVRHRRRF